MAYFIDPETELPMIPGDFASQEIRAAELIGKKELLRQAWNRAMQEGWGKEGEK